MVDINNVELNVGDRVVFAYATSGLLHKGEIVKFTEEGLSVKYVTRDYSKWNSITKTYDKFKDTITNLRAAEGRVMKLG